MAATVVYSPSFIASGVVLTSQTLEEQPTGLIRVRMGFAVTPARSANIPNLFFPDAQPPIYPSVISRDILDRRTLHLENHSVVNANGLWTVSATYAGARRQSAAYRGITTRDKESRVTPPFRVGNVSVSVRFVSAVVKTTIAGVYSSSLDSEFTGGNASSLIYSIAYGAISLPGASIQPVNLSRLRLPSAGTILASFRPRVQVSSEINNVTNSVVLATTIRSVILNT